jgi:DNA polymerase I-like protein with 3'-5' exonuclease and polymerase domains
MELVLDVETTTTREGWVEGKSLLGGTPSPYHPENKLVMVQYKFVGRDTPVKSPHNGGEDIAPEGYFWFNHEKFNGGDSIRENFRKVQDILMITTRMIGHNLKFDLSWLYECGFTYEGSVWDTMIFEYLQAKGLKPGLGLQDCAERRECTFAKTDFLKDSLKAGINTDKMDPEELIIYGMADIYTTEELYLKQKDLLATDQDTKTMKPALDLMNEMCLALTDMERNGCAIDVEALDNLEREYKAEQEKLQERIEEIVQTVMGDKPYNVGSPEQLSQIIYSFRFRDAECKKAWSQAFDIGTEVRNGVKKKKYPMRLSDHKITKLMHELTEDVYKTEARHCLACDGRGHYYKTKKNGELYKKPTTCKECDGLGIQYVETGEKAGFNLHHPGSWYATANGFAGSKDVIDVLLKRAEEKERLNAKGQLAVEFLSACQRLSAISSYLNSVMGGIRRGMYHGILHTSFQQTVAATGRLSSTSPNCFPPEVEVLTARGFVSWADVNNDDILAQWDKQSRVITYTQPTKLIKYNYDGELIHLSKSRYQANPALSMVCTPDHRFQLINRKTGKQNSYTADCYLKDALQPQSGFKSDTGWTLPDDELILWCALQADGSRSQWGQVRFKFQKLRKIERLRKTLDNLGIIYQDKAYTTFGHGKTQHGREIYIRREEAAKFSHLTKMFDPRQITSMSGSTVRKFAEEILFWDGCYTRSSQYCSEHKQNAEAVLVAQIMAGHTAKMRMYKNKYYIVDIIRDKVGNLTSNMKHTRIPYQGLVYCATMPKGTVIVRHKGTVWLTENCQNMPRGNTFPIRKVFVSKFEGGKILSRDLSQLEFRVAAFLSGCEKAYQFIESGQDIHMVSGEFYFPEITTVDATTKKLLRTKAKSETFGPLYGKLNEYAEHFYDTFPGIREWHKRLGEEALRHKQVTIPSGRIYAFPGARRDMDKYGRPIVMPTTQIYNYPVQGFATADIVPVVLITLWRLFKQSNLKSYLMLTVHDDITADVHPEEIEDVKKLFDTAFGMVYDECRRRFGVEIDIPLDSEMSIGDNWLEQEEIS